MSKQQKKNQPMYQKYHVSCVNIKRKIIFYMKTNRFAKHYLSHLCLRINRIFYPLSKGDLTHAQAPPPTHTHTYFLKRGTTFRTDPSVAAGHRPAVPRSCPALNVIEIEAKILPPLHSTYTSQPWFTVSMRGEREGRPSGPGNLPLQASSR